MKKLYILLIIFQVSSCTLLNHKDDFDYFENEIARVYIPKGYSSIIVNSDDNKPNNYLFLYPDSSFFFIGKGSGGNLNVTEVCCDTLRDSENNIQLNYLGKPQIKNIRSANFPSVQDESLSEYYFEYNEQKYTDWYFDRLTKTFRKQIIVSALDYYYGYQTAGYLCKNPQDTVKLNNVLEMIRWKYDMNEKFKLKRIQLTIE